MTAAPSSGPVWLQEATETAAAGLAGYVGEPFERLPDGTVPYEPHARAMLAASLPGVLAHVEKLIDEMRMHIPPPTDPMRKAAIVQRSTCNRAAAVVAGLRREVQQP